MRLSHLFPAMLLVLAGLPLAGAADLAGIDRTLKDEPKYAGTPKYCLLTFGHEGATQVWLVRDGDVLHVLASPDGKSPKVWRKAVRYFSTFQIGDIWEDGGKTCHKNLRYYPGSRHAKLMVQVAGHLQTAGRDPRGTLEFGASPKEAPVVRFNGPLTLDLFHTQEPLRNNEVEDITAVVGTPGQGPGTFAALCCDAYPRNAWPTAVIEYPAKEGGKPLVAKVRLAEE
jgi:hypothetical protein